jgi:predicted negative regulator of RcsB-dependent stress response
LAWTHLALGDLEAARQVAEAALPIAFNVKAEYLPDLYVCIGTILLALGEGDEAQTNFLQAVQQTSSSSLGPKDLST